jgi:nucleoside-diphosphate-sugar epimerase
VNVLVIGGTRFVGYLLAWRLIASGHRPTLLNRGTIPDPFGDRVERIRADRTTPDFARALAGRSFDAAVDFAAYVGSHALGAIDALRGRVGHYVFVSTGQVYLLRESCPRPSREEDYAGPVMARPADPDDAAAWDYGVGKRACEDALAAAWERERFPSTRVRIPIVNGERDGSGRFEGYVRRVLDGGPVILPDGGAQRVRHVYGADVARAIAAMLGSSATFGRAFNLAQDETPTLAELVAIIADALGAPTRIAALPSERIVAAGLRPERVSPFSTRWAARARARLIGSRARRGSGSRCGVRA